jgi:hypothetical protein
MSGEPISSDTSRTGTQGHTPSSPTGAAARICPYLLVSDLCAAVFSTERAHFDYPGPEVCGLDRAIVVIRTRNTLNLVQ